MEGKFDGMYMNHPANKHDEWDELKNIKIEAYQKGRSQRTMFGEKSTGNGGIGKILTLSSQIQYVLCTDCAMSQADIIKIIGFYNHSN